jgi:hypothetical protein
LLLHNSAECNCCNQSHETHFSSSVHLSIVTVTVNMTYFGYCWLVLSVLKHTIWETMSFSVIRSEGGKFPTWLCPLKRVSLDHKKKFWAENIFN